MAFSMTEDELRTRIRNGTPIKILAELNGVTDQTIYNWMKKNNIKRPGAEDRKFLQSLPTIEINPKDMAIIDVIEGQIDSLKDEMAKRQVEINNMAYQVERWEFLKSQLEKEVEHGSN